MDIKRENLIATLGGEEPVARMDSEAKADALEDFLSSELDKALTSTDPHFPTVAEIEQKIPTRHFRMGVGNLFVAQTPGAKVKILPPMPDKPTLLKTDHGYWAAQMYSPYVPEKTAFAIKYHQALRFFADPIYGYEYPDLYRRLFGEDYVPLPHIRADYEMLKKHPWYEAPRLVTVNDYYSFDPNAKVSIDPFREIIGRHFKQHKEGLGNDNSPVAHMWRTMARPDMAL
jgi:hypothetical protein